MTSAPPPAPTAYASMPGEDLRYRHAGPHNQEDSSSKGLGIAALVCSFVPSPMTLLAAGVVGGIVVSRGQLRAGSGRGFALAALIVTSVWLVLGVGFIGLVFAFGAGDDAGRESGPVRATDLRVGDCLAEVPLGTSVITVDLVPCDQEHEAEVFAEFELSAMAYPGERVTTALSENGCRERLPAFLGKGTDTSELDINFFMPLRETWSVRTVTCMVGHTDATTGTLRAAPRRA